MTVFTNEEFFEQDNFLTIAEASSWASHYLQKNVTVSNISYLVQYGKIKKYSQNGVTKVARDELERYYQSYKSIREQGWKEKLGEDVNFFLSFHHLKESETTKHVHRLHPYKGKFIPQLVEYFLDNHTDEFKKVVCFQPDDIILDPFCGSGTTLVQANELGIHGIGIDVSIFNSLISNVKVSEHDIVFLQKEILQVTEILRKFTYSTNIPEFEEELTQELNEFNRIYFPAVEFKYKVQKKLIDQNLYGKEHEKNFLPCYWSKVEKYKIKVLQDNSSSFLDTWYLATVRNEIDVILAYFKKMDMIHFPTPVKRALQLILSRTVRSCRATSHADLATLLEPISTTYYCAKHGKICKPLFSMLGWWERYSQDTVKRLSQFAKLRTKTFQHCLIGDSRTIDICGELRQQHSCEFADLVQQKKIRGIFSSPPYIGLIDYHEQHAYSYELFGLSRQDQLEIGPMAKGTGRSAREYYVQGIADVLNHAKKYFASDYHIFLVANDKFNLYPRIAQLANMEIVQQYKRPVLNRTEKDKSAYSESIFYLQ